MIIANDLKLGFPRPGCRRDGDFFEFTFSRFKELLLLAEEHGNSLCLVGHHLHTMKLSSWLKIIHALSDYDLTVYVVTNHRPSEDLIAMHNIGHLKVVMPGHKVQTEKMETIVHHGHHFTVDDVEIHIATGLIKNQALELKLGSVIQQSAELPFVTSYTKKTLTQLPLEHLPQEQDLIYFDYVEALTNSTVSAGSSFIQKLVQSKDVESHSVAGAIERINDDEVKSYLLDLYEKSSTYNELLELS